MNREKALEILGIANDLSDPDIVYQVKQQLKGLHNDNTGKLSEKIEACKLLTKDQPEVFSNFVISVIKDNKPDFLELLLKTVKNDDKFNYLNTESADGETPLSFALGNDKWSKEVKVVNLLLEHGASAHTRGKGGKSVFHYIFDGYGDFDCYEGIVKSLLDKGVSPNIQDDRGRAPLHYLCEHGYRKGSVEIVKLLLRRGAGPDLKDKDGKKPVDLVNSGSDVGEMFGAINYEKAAILRIAALLATVCSIALVYLAMSISINIAQISCFAFAAVMATASLCCACYAIKTLFFSPGPSSEFTEARAEFLNSQKIAGTV
jgi:hypothetical protein